MVYWNKQKTQLSVILNTKSILRPSSIWMHFFVYFYIFRACVQRTSGRMVQECVVVPVPTSRFEGQKPGTSGLRKTVKVSFLLKVKRSPWETMSLISACVFICYCNHKTTNGVKILKSWVWSWSSRSQNVGQWTVILSFLLKTPEDYQNWRLHPKTNSRKRSMQKLAVKNVSNCHTPHSLRIRDSWHTGFKFFYLNILLRFSSRRIILRTLFKAFCPLWVSFTWILVRSWLGWWVLFFVELLVGWLVG